MVKGMARYPPNLMITNKNKLHITGCCFWGKKVTSYDIFCVFLQSSSICRNKTLNLTLYHKVD